LTPDDRTVARDAERRAGSAAPTPALEARLPRQLRGRLDESRRKLCRVRLLPAPDRPRSLTAIGSGRGVLTTVLFEGGRVDQSARHRECDGVCAVTRS